MKALLVTALSCLAAFAVGANDPSNATRFIATNKGQDLDAPIFDATGQRLSGSQFRVVIYGGSTAGSLAPVFDGDGNPFPSMPMGEGTRAGYFRGGLFLTSAFGVGGSYLQVKAWDSRLGETYETAHALGLGGVGESKVFASFGSHVSESPGFLAYMVGLESFSLSGVVPEPESWALLGVGFTALAWFSRRRP